MSSPSDYELGYGEFLQGQEETILWATKIKDGTVGILQSPTGTGKTAIASAMGPLSLSQGGKVISLTNTKVLQAENYAKGYHFAPLYGQNNYECVLPGVKVGTTYAHCKYKSNTSRCPSKANCPYLHAMDRATSISTARVTLNYAYWVHKYATWKPYYLFMDEGHKLSDVVVDWAGVEISKWEMENYELPVPPILVRPHNPKAGQADPKIILVAYLRRCVPYVKRWIAEKQRRRNKSGKLLDIISRAERLVKKLESTSSMLMSSSGEWFIFSNAGGVRVKPYSAREHFLDLISTSKRTIIMSATIGDIDTFVHELGIQRFVSRDVESPYPISSRPIMDLGVPILGERSPGSAWQKQGDIIAKLFHDNDPSWSGIIHTTSEVKARGLAKILHSRGLQDRVYVPRRIATDHQVEEWHREMRKNPGAIAIAWSLWEGYNGTEEKINVVAKTPYPNLGDLYEKIRADEYKAFYKQRTAWSLVQGLGRTRRLESDYDTEDSINGIVAIADGGYMTIRKFIPKYIRDSIVK